MTEETYESKQLNAEFFNYLTMNFLQAAVAAAAFLIAGVAWLIQDTATPILYIVALVLTASSWLAVFGSERTLTLYVASRREKGAEVPYVKLIRMVYVAVHGVFVLAVLSAVVKGSLLGLWFLALAGVIALPLACVGIIVWEGYKAGEVALPGQYADQ